MSDLHQLLTLAERPITRENLKAPVLHFLHEGIPATYTLEDAILERFGVVCVSSEGRNKGESGNTTPLHILCRSAAYWAQGYDMSKHAWLKDGLLDLNLNAASGEETAKEGEGEGEDSERMKCPGIPFPLVKATDGTQPLSTEEFEVLLEVMDVFFEYGAGWNFVDFQGKTLGELFMDPAGDKIQNKGIETMYQRCVSAGVQAELLLRKFEDIEWVEEIDDVPMEELVSETAQEPATDNSEDVVVADPAEHQETYLNTALEYTDDGSALVTASNRDGVMMDWETDIMELAANTLCKNFVAPLDDAEEEEDCYNVLNIGFGMGIIDTFIETQLSAEAKNSGKKYKHYISEAHPDVLNKLKTDGWYENPNVVILEGRWQDSLNKVLDEGEVFFDGIYYDTFSEHYKDMLDLYDLIIGLIKPTGVFSFFNGLGADNAFFYDVYKEIVKIDMNNYGLQCEYETQDVVKIMEKYGQVWENVKQSYFSCKQYYHPTIQFQ